MKEKLYTIPVTDAFNENSECPLCSMYHHLEEAAIEYTLGPSYMEDDVRAQTDKTGFCTKHMQLLYENQNRLGLALILSTHIDYTIKNIEEMTKQKKQGIQTMFKKNSYSPISNYTNQLSNHCFICNRIDKTFNRYIATIFYLYKTEENFRKTFASSKGFCTNHYGQLCQHAQNSLSGNTLTHFIDDLNHIYLENMKRVRNDLEWFKDKFDYRYKDEPWKNAKDALPRAITKTNSIL